MKKVIEITYSLIELLLSGAIMLPYIVVCLAFMLFIRITMEIGLLERSIGVPIGLSAWENCLKTWAWIDHYMIRPLYIGRKNEWNEKYEKDLKDIEDGIRS